MHIVLVAILAVGLIAVVLNPKRSTPVVDSDEPVTVSSAASVSDTVAEASAPTALLADPPGVLADVHPGLPGIDGWLQSEVQSLEELRGQVVVVEFWTFGCYNCKNRIPYTQDLYAAYQSQGLEIVGIHSPEFSYEEDPDNVTQALADLGVTWPVALDTNRLSFRRWQGSPAYWPRTYVIDQEGQVRHDHIGEGAYEELEEVVAYLLAEGP